MIDDRLFILNDDGGINYNNNIHQHINSEQLNNYNIVIVINIFN